MRPVDILETDRISVANPAGSKKRVLEEAANLLAAESEGPTGEQVFERLLERERLGSTGLTGGVALPHARMPGVTEAKGAFLRLSDAVEFDAMDGQPVDLVFALLVPEHATEEHLQLLAARARLFSNESLRTRLRSGSASEIRRLLAEEDAANAKSGEGPGSVRLPA